MQPKTNHFGWTKEETVGDHGDVLDRWVPMSWDLVGGDPVKQGLTNSFAQPGGNATGISLLTSTLEPKRLGLLSEIVPRVRTVGFLLNPGTPGAESQLGDMQKAASAAHLRIHILRASTDPEIAAAFETIARQELAALAVAADPFFDTRRATLVALAARHKVPTIYHFREYAEVGGLASYGIDAREVYRQIGLYVGRILRGARPTDLPVMQATKFEFVINLKAAKALGLTIPQTLLLGADKVIE